METKEYKEVGIYISPTEGKCHKEVARFSRYYLDAWFLYHRDEEDRSIDVILKDVTLILPDNDRDIHIDITSAIGENEKQWFIDKLL
jgi:hypothetical protein